MTAPLLAFARGIDRLNDGFGAVARWAVLLSCLISALNAVVRYALDYSSNAFLEIQWYLFAGCVMLGAAQVLRLNEHVRVDLFGLLVFLLPVIGYFAVLAWKFFVIKLSTGMSPGDSIASLGLVSYVLKLASSGELSGNAGGLILWPAVLLMPLGFAMVWLQGLAEVIKRLAWLAGSFEMETHYERPLQ